MHGKEFSQRACIQTSTHQHALKVGDYKDNQKHINALINKDVERTPQATYNKIVLEANKDIVGEFILCGDNDTHRFVYLKNSNMCLKVVES